jgi:uncharacterized delta-60 repeat protein
MRYRRRLVALTLAAPVLAAWLAFSAPPAAAADGDFDTMFSGDGKLVTDFGDLNTNHATDAVVDANGKLVVVGQAGIDMGVARFNPDGSRDMSFDGDGFKVIDSGTTSSGEIAKAMAIQSDGKIVVFGDAGLSGPDNSDLVLARLNPGGTLDDTFDGPGAPGNGVFRLSFSNQDFAHDVAVSGTQLVFGGVQNSSPVPFVLRTDAGGTPDAGFDADGVMNFDFGAAGGSFLYSLVVQTDGKVVALGKPNAASGFGLARITTTGALDTASFHSPDGKFVAAMPPGGYPDAQALDVVLDDTGIVVAGGIAQLKSGWFDYDPMVARVTSAGALDSGFGTGGYTILPLGGEPPSALIPPDDSVFSNLVRQADGKLLAGGILGPYTPADERDQLAARFSAAGALDPTFSADAPAGILVSDLGTALGVDGMGLSSSGVAYLVGSPVSAGDVIGISAICATPPSCTPPVSVPSPTPTPTPTPTPPAAGPTGQRAAALKKCAKVKDKPKRKKCKRRAQRLPV